MTRRVILKHLGKTLLVEYQTDRDKNRDIWIFTGKRKRIVIGSSQLPKSAPVARLPVEVRPASDKTHTAAWNAVHDAIVAEMFHGLTNAPPEYAASIKRHKRLDGRSALALQYIIEQLPRDSTGGIMPRRGEIKIREIITGYRHEAVFKDGTVILVNVAECPVQEVKPDRHKSDTEQRHADPDCDTEQVALKIININPGLSGVERLALSLRLVSKWPFSKIADELPKNRQNNRPYTRQGVRKMVWRAAREASLSGLLTRGTYRSNVRAEADRGDQGKGNNGRAG